MSNLNFDPAKVTYACRYVRASYKKKDGSKGQPRMQGPYWYANEMVNGGFKTYYIGKVLPDYLVPYVPKETYLDHPNPEGIFGPKNKKVIIRGASDTILEALDRGEQVVLDLKKIAKDCNAYVDKIGDKRYVFYRDSK